MKTRHDFVSNSSSSSFILKDTGFFRHFGITKQDLDDAIAELCGGKDMLAKKLADEIAEHEAMLAKAKIEDGVFFEKNQSVKFEIKYRTDRLRELKTKGLGLWSIYDMTDKGDRRRCFREWDSHFALWFAPKEGEYKKWSEFVDMLRWNCHFDNVSEVVNGEDLALTESEYSRKTGRLASKTVSGGAEFLKRVKDKLEIKTMKEVLHGKDCTLMIHFAENAVYRIGGMKKPGRSEERDYNTAEENEKIRNSEYESESYSAERFFEILIRHLVEKGKVDLSDPELLEYWKIDEDDDWYIKKNPGKKYYLSGDTATWKDVYDDMLGCNAIMHEG